jgi:hypothetical protein
MPHSDSHCALLARRWASLRQRVRVARNRVVIVTIDVQTLARLWIIDDYFPERVSCA